MEIEHVTVNITIPKGEVRLVTMHPFIKFPSPNDAPYQWAADAIDNQFAAIDRTLNLAQNGFDNRGANFTVFPEYAIPGLDGVLEIDKRISSDVWPKETIIIAGVHGILKKEYASLCNLAGANVSTSNAPYKIDDYQWVNSSVIWTKDQVGQIRKWVQPKIRPAFKEDDSHTLEMFRGNALYVFRCQYDNLDPFRFVTLICYDWVASGGGTDVRHELLTQLEASYREDHVPLHWAFVIQNNSKPNDKTFLDGTHHFLTDTKEHSELQRTNSIVVHVNTAASELPARNGPGGFSACVFSPQALFVCEGCKPTVCMQPKKLRDSPDLGLCKDVVFREMGECIHSFTIRVPRWVEATAADKTNPIPSAHVHATTDTDDPRLCGGPVPAAVKWLNDQLDIFEPLSSSDLAGTPLKLKAEKLEPDLIQNIRGCDHRTGSDRIHWATGHRSELPGPDIDERQENADIWDDHEGNALAHVLESLIALGLAYSIDVESAALHAELIGDEGSIQVVAVLGKSHEDCRKHFDSQVRIDSRDPILVITRNPRNTVLHSGESLRIDEVHANRRKSFLDYSTLINTSINAADSSALKRILDEHLPDARFY